jgi:hypothetical protein
MRTIPPIAKLSERLHLEIEQAVRRFPRYHRYQVGADLRRQVAEVRRLVDRAWRDRSRQLAWTEQLRWAIDELRLSLQLGSQLRAFSSFAVFESLILLTEDLGRQVGGWLKKQQQDHLTGQNPPRSAAAGARPDTEYPRRLAGANR